MPFDEFRAHANLRAARHERHGVLRAEGEAVAARARAHRMAERPLPSSTTNRPDPTVVPLGPSGGGGLFSTAMDYARFCEMLLNGGQFNGVRLLAPRTVEMMRTNHVNPEPLKTMHAGTGWGMDFQRGHGRGRGGRAVLERHLQLVRHRRHLVLDRSGQRFGVCRHDAASRAGPPRRSVASRAIWCIRLWSIDEREADDEAEGIDRHREWAFAAFVLHARAQNTQAQPKPTADPYANNAAPARSSFRSRLRPARTATPRRRAARRRQSGAVRSGHVEIRPRVQSAGRRENLESGEDQDDAGRESHRRHALQLHRSGHLLRDGERRLRLHLDRDAARPARLGGGGADVAHVSEREGGPGCARRLHRRARDPARARRRRAGRRRPDGRHRRRSHRGAQLDLLPAARPPQQRRRPGVRRRRCGAACPADIATRSTTTSC